MSPESHMRDINGSPLMYHAKDIQMRPRLLEKSLAQNPSFQELPDGFKRIFSEDKVDQKLKLPVVGYAGHRKGIQAENMFARNFRDTSINSKKYLRNLQQNTQSFYKK